MILNDVHVGNGYGCFKVCIHVTFFSPCHYFIVIKIMDKTGHHWHNAEQ